MAGRAVTSTPARTKRRPVQFVRDQPGGVDEFLEWLADKREQVLDLTTQNFAHFDNAHELQNGQVRRRPEGHDPVTHAQRSRKRDCRPARLTGRTRPTNHGRPRLPWTLVGDGAAGSTSDSGSEGPRFDPWSPSQSS